MLGLLCTVLVLPSASAVDIESPLALSLTHAYTNCIPDVVPPDQKTNLPSNCPAVQPPPIDAYQMNSASRAADAYRLQAEEAKFFDAFSHDQIKETKCELNLLDALDQIPGVPDAPVDIKWGTSDSIKRAGTNANNSDIQISQTAYNNQKVILENIWKKLPELEPLKQEVEKARNALPAGFVEGVGILTPPGIIQAKTLYTDAKARINAYMIAEARYHAALKEVMSGSGSDEAVEDYTKHVLSEWEKGTKDDKAKKNFIEYALQAVDPGRLDLSFQKQVIEPLRYSSNQRLCSYETFSTDSYERALWNDGNKKGICGTYVSTPPWSSDPTEQWNAERKRKRILMETDAPLAFMQKTKEYQKDYSKFSCLLVDKYRKGPKIIHTGETVAVTIASFGVGFWLNSARVAFEAAEVGAKIGQLSSSAQTVIYNAALISTGIGKVIALPAFVRNECASDSSSGDQGIIPQSVLAAPVCGKIKPGDPSSTKILEQSVKQNDCLTALFLSLTPLKMLALVPTSGDSDTTADESTPKKQ
jgi:hypothetical protein